MKHNKFNTNKLDIGDLVYIKSTDSVGRIINGGSVKDWRDQCRTDQDGVCSFDDLEPIRDMQIRVNLVDVRDYVYMRENNFASSVKWKQVRSLNMPNGCTFWQMIAKIDGYDDRFEPSMSQLIKACSLLQIVIKNKKGE